MPILIDRTFAEVTPESAECGDLSNCGMLARAEPVTFRELVDLMREHPVPSCSPARGEAFEWLNSHPWIADYGTGTEREESLHYSRENPARRAKYWRLAMVAAGIIPGGSNA